MINSRANKASMGICGGIFLFAMGFIARVALWNTLPDTRSRIIAVASVIGSFVLNIAAAIVFTWGCYNYAKAKGQPGVLGILGLVPFAGWIVLCVLPDHGDEKEPQGFPILPMD